MQILLSDYTYTPIYCHRHLEFISTASISIPNSLTVQVTVIDHEPLWTLTTILLLQLNVTVLPSV
jgi:hypothetical protein